MEDDYLSPEPEVGGSNPLRRATTLFLSTREFIELPSSLLISEHFGTTSPLDFGLRASAIRELLYLGVDIKRESRVRMAKLRLHDSR